MTIRLEAHFADEGQASQAAHLEGTAPEVSEAAIQTCAVVIDLIRTDTACK
jgi:hypothetical protein